MKETATTFKGRGGGERGRKTVEGATDEEITLLPKLSVTIGVTATVGFGVAVCCGSGAERVLASLSLFSVVDSGGKSSSCTFRTSCSIHVCIHIFMPIS